MPATPDLVIRYGMAEIGKPYVWGDEGPNSFDCSGLMQWIFGRAGIELPRTAREQQRWAAPVRREAARPGDFVFWGDPATHVALYLGDGRILSAPGRGKHVRVSGLYGSPTFGRAHGLGVGSGLPSIGAGVSGVVPAGIWDDASAMVRGDLRDMAVLGVVVLGGVALVVLGGWQAVRGQ